MKKIRYSESQIIKVFKEWKAVAQSKRSAGNTALPNATYYTWKNKYGRMEASDIKRLKELEGEGENRRLKQRYATSAWTTRF